MQNIRRTAFLKLCVSIPDVLSHVAGPASRMHSLHLESESQHSFGRGPFQPFTITNSLINGLPRLRKLTVMAVLSQYNFRAENLTYLYLTLFSDHDTQPRPSLPETLRIVHAAQSLETLCLDRRCRVDIDPEETSYHVPPPSPISPPHALPRLRSLRLAGYVDCLYFLGYFTFSSAITVDIDKQPRSIPPDLRHPNSSGLTQLLLSPPVRSLVLDYLENGECERDLAYSDELTLHTFHAALSRETYTPRLTVNFTEFTLELADSMKDLYTSLPLSHLRTLHLQHQNWEPEFKDHITVSFGSLSGLHTVSIIGGDPALDMVPALGDISSGPEQSAADAPATASVSILFPGLRKLWLHDWVEKRRAHPRYNPSAPENEWVTHDLLEQLVCALAARKRSRYGAKSLVLIDCEVSENGLARIRETVGNAEVCSSGDIRSQA
ncbi:hypothetical protein AAF712_005855 [Marasmius tenuissimus]|uniref:Uncharacterized protein n=1 Tax=Marasmius tenuissimus TaxID=585030 RepID=A0ABR3A217_9AGAR